MTGSERGPGSADVPVGMAENKADGNIGAPWATNVALTNNSDFFSDISLIIHKQGSPFFD